jgi:tetratricopeptide (TPR) repeat protein
MLETDELIDGLLAGAGLEAGLRERIRASSDGNPLFVEQMLAMIEESPAEVTVPASIQALLAARLDQLPPRERAALERGAVEGHVFHLGAVAALASDDPEVPARLLGLVRKELVRPTVATLPDEEAFRFRHLLVRDAAYESIPKLERAQMHERFASWLEQRGGALVELDELLGYHLEQSARYRIEIGRSVDGLEARAAEHLGAAGVRALARDDAHAAVSLVGRAVELLPAGHDRGILLGRLGLAYELLGRFDDAEAALDEAIASGGEDAAAFASFIKVVVRSKASAEALDVADEGAIRARLETMADSASDLTLACGYTTLALMQSWFGNVEDSLVDANRALKHARQARDQDLERKALIMVGNAKQYGSTPWREVEEHAAEMRALGLPRLSLEAAAARAQGRFEESRALYAQITHQLFERGARVLALASAMSSGRLEMLAGKVDRALELLGEAWAGLGEVGEQGHRSTVGAVYADVLARAGRLDEAEAILREVDAITSQDDFMTVTEAIAARAMVASGRGDHERAIELARRGVELADARQYLVQRHSAWLELGEVLLAAGRHEEARKALEQARALAEQKGSTATVDRADALLRTLSTR